MASRSPARSSDEVFEHLLLATSADAAEDDHIVLGATVNGLPATLMESYLRDHPERAHTAALELAECKEERGADPAAYQIKLRKQAEQLAAEARLANNVADAAPADSALAEEFARYLQYLL